MPSPHHYWRCLGLSLLIVGIEPHELTDCHQLSPAVGTPAARRLSRGGAAFERPLVRNERHAYTIELGRQETLEVEVYQNGVDLKIGVLDPHGRQLVQIDSANRRWGEEPVRVVATEKGEHRILMTALTGAGSYRFELKPVRAATETDRKWFEAALELDNAQRLREGGGDLAATLQGFSRARQLYADLGQSDRALLTEIEIGLALEARQRLPEALATYSGARAGAGQPRLQVYLLDACARVSLAQNRLAEARAFLDSAIDVARSSGNRFDEALSLQMLALQRRRSGELQEAVDLSLRAQAIWHDLDEKREESSSLYNLGVLYLSIGREIAALDALSRAVDERRNLGDGKSLSATLVLLGQTYLRLGRREDAIESLREALETRWPERSDLDDAQALERLAYAKEDQDRLAADQTYTTALGLYGHRDPLRAAFTQAERGWFRQRTGLPGAALDLKWALRAFSRLHEPTGIAFSLLGLAKVDQSAGRLEQAFSHAREALEIVEAQRSKLNSTTLKQAFLHGRRPFFEVPIELLMQLHQERPQIGFDRIAFELSEMSRARALLDQLEENDAKTGDPAGTVRTELDLVSSQLIARRLERWNSLAAGRSADPALEARIEELLIRYESLDQSLVHRQTAAGASFPRARPLDLEEIQHQLDDESLLIQFFLSEHQSFLWVVGKSRLTAFRLPPRAEIEVRARQLSSLWSSPDSTATVVQAQVVSRSLSRILLEPAWPILARSRRLIVAADGVLNYIPFAALPSPAGDGQALCATHEVVSVHSLSVVALQRRLLAGRKEAPERLAVIADPAYGSSNPPAIGGNAWAFPEVQRSATAAGLGTVSALPFSRLEGERLMAMVPAEVRQAFLGFSASRANVLSADLGRFQIVHFATHGILDPQMPQLSGLLLSLVDSEGRKQDGYLAAYEVERLRLPVELVVLSACRTGLGAEVEGEGLVGLAQSFLAAGARRVAVSLWAVEDRSTSDLMVLFYQGLLQRHQTPAAALREAMLEMQKRYPDHPHRWAGFVLYGDWRTVPTFHGVEGS